MKIAASALVAGLALGLAAAQQPPPACTGLAVTSTLPKSTRPGAMTTYTLKVRSPGLCMCMKGLCFIRHALALTHPLHHLPKITNSGSAAVSGLSLIAHLPDFSEYIR